MKPLFLYGTLRHPPLLAAVSGADLAVVPAVLQGHATLQAHAPDGTAQNFPLITARAGAQAAGLLIYPDAQARTRLDAYERAFEYDIGTVMAEGAGGPVEAGIYLPQPGRWQGGAAWSLEDWVEADGALAVETAAEVMALLPHTPPAAVQARYRMLQMRVASRARARSQPAPVTLRRAPRPDDLEIIAQTTPYAYFFGVEEADLRFRRFNGSFSDKVRRAGFVMADAVTVLPYDPARDRVLVVEQFRFGPFARGDLNAWTLEPIAGRIDPGESPEQALRREAGEEAGLNLGALHPVGSYYPSPGAVSEYLYSYVGMAALGPEAGGVRGLESEAEDIRAHVIAFAHLMELVDSGEVQNGPLLISAHWLARHRDRLRDA